MTLGQGRLTAEAPAIAAHHGPAGERALPRPHPLLRRQPAGRGDRLIEKPQTVCPYGRGADYLDEPERFDAMQWTTNGSNDVCRSQSGHEEPPCFNHIRAFLENKNPTAVTIISYTWLYDERPRLCFTVPTTGL